MLGQTTDSKRGGFKPKKANEKKNAATMASLQEGINVDYFVRSCKFLAGSLPQINKRILVAQGKFYQALSKL